MLDLETDFYFFNDFDESLLNDVVKPLMQSATQLPAPTPYRHGARINLYINTYGGQAEVVRSALDAVSIAQRRGLEVATFATGAVFSCGSLLAVAGTKGLRYMSKSARHLMHFGWAAAEGTNQTELERSVKDAKAHFDFVYNHYSTHARVPMLRRKMDDDMLFVDYPTAIRWGLADKEM